MEAEKISRMQLDRRFLIFSSHVLIRLTAHSIHALLSMIESYLVSLSIFQFNYQNPDGIGLSCIALESALYVLHQVDTLVERA